MRPHSQQRTNSARRFVPALLIVVLAWQTAMGQSALRPDPVDELRRALKPGPNQQIRKDVLDFRRATLKKKIADLRTIPELGRAMLLQEWRDNVLEKELATIDQEMRTLVANRFESAVRDVLRTGDGPSRLAAAHLVGELAVVARGRAAPESGASEDFVQAQLAKLIPDLIALSRTKDDPRLPEAAARALGKLQPSVGDLKELGAGLDGLMKSDRLPTRRAAAEAVGAIIQTVAQRERSRRVGARLSSFRENVVNVAAALMPTAAQGLTDRDVEVRRSCALALQRATSVLADLVIPIDPQAGDLFPPAGHPLNETESTEIRGYRAEVDAELKGLGPLIQSLKLQSRHMIRALEDDDSAVRVSAGKSLEMLATARGRLLRRAAMVPWAFREKGEKGDEDPLLESLRAAVPILAKTVAHSEARVRLASLYALEELEGEAAPAADAVVKALVDKNSYVRWSAARVLGKMAPQQADKAVVGLAGLLKDDNEDVRTTAAAALIRYGPAAKAAVPALNELALKADGAAAIRILAIQVLEAVGPDAQAAVPGLLTGLTAPDAETRRAAAAALSRIGALPKPAVEALQKAVDDPDSNVRLAASEALLAGAKPSALRPAVQGIYPLDSLESKNLAEAMFEAQQEGDLRALTAARLETARAIINHDWQSYLAGRGALDAIHESSERLVNAERATEDRKTGSVAALHRHWKQTVSFEQVGRARYEVGSPGTELEFAL